LSNLTVESREAIERSFVRIFSAAAVLVVFIPALVALAHAPPGSSYLGFQYNTDDHMVYAAWMRQAMDGRLLMDNRFTSDPQPGLTINLYFFALGLVAKLTGIGLAAAIGRAVFSVLFIFSLYRVVRRMDFTVYGSKLAITVVTVGAGLGFLFWQNFGTTLGPGAPDWISSFLHGQLPTDVWQPEGFVFSSMLTNGLFMVSLFLMVTLFTAFLDARTNARAVWVGFGCIFVLMNIHSYDVLTVALVMVGFLAGMIPTKQVTRIWVGRSALIALGAVAPALWFVHVLSQDTVFQARAATETYSTNFRTILLGYLPLLGLGLWGIVARSKATNTLSPRKWAGFGIAVALVLVLTILAGGHTSEYFLTASGWGAAFVAAVAACYLLSDPEPAWNLAVSWALIGLIAIYFPGLFQRKLTMGLSVPWALLTAFGVEALLKKADRSSRNLSTILVLIVLGATSLRWLFRDLQFIQENVSNTTRQPVYLSPDARNVLHYLNQLQGRNVLLALPGIQSPSADSEGHPIPDSFGSPIIPDYSPIVSGLTGVYTYAGHWSETPDYGKRVGEMNSFFFDQPFGAVKHPMTDDDRKALIERSGATYALVPTKSAFPELPIVDPAKLGQEVYAGSQLTLVKLAR
jgi:hypothetical protein